MTISKDCMEEVKRLLESYDKLLRDKAEHYADMMADWAKASQSETIRYAEKYETIRKERQRIYDELILIGVALKSEEQGTT